MCFYQTSAMSFYEQLCQFNPNWKKYQQQAPKGEAIDFRSDKAYIAAHLESVLHILRNKKTTTLNEDQRNAREQLIEVLDSYRIMGKFPINYYKKERIPVFIDEHDTHCAVGYLLQKSGYEALARNIAAANNYAWLKEIDHPELIAWQQAAGFSLEELKLIQGAYDFYQPNALTAPNRIEIPQKPAQMLHYFTKENGSAMKAKKEHIWCYGEGKNGILNGRWIQNYAIGLPWIEGFYSNGKRTGQWKEYYQGARQLCRTENWRDDQLNGVRKRFDRSGILIEEILFKDGVAVTKTNYEQARALKWVRKPIDSAAVATEIYTYGGRLIAEGKERVHNPSGLLWFQNIELTALNMASITSREVASSNRSNGLNSSMNSSSSGLYNMPPLVEYRKEGEWVYYKQYGVQKHEIDLFHPILASLMNDFPLLEQNETTLFYQLKKRKVTKVNNTTTTHYERIYVSYDQGKATDFCAFNNTDFFHLHLEYYENQYIDLNINRIRYPLPVSQKFPNQRFDTHLPIMIKTIGFYNQDHQKIGLWQYFTLKGSLRKTEDFIIPHDE